MRYLSVCSGIEAATVAWHPLGWEPVAFAEIERFPSAVIAYHYPSVSNWGDLNGWKGWTDADVDVLVGGTPCQSFSVAGLRGGLADPRGNLALTYLAVAERYRPRWIVWENVPGVLSSNGGRDFGSFLGALGQLGYGFAYRVLDAQYIRTRRHPRAVPQRRRRVFVVGCLGDWRRAAAVLFDRESMSGSPAPRREAGQVASADAARCPVSSGRGLEHTGDTRGQGNVVACDGENNTAGAIDVATACNAHPSRHDLESETLIVPTTFDWQAGASGDTSFRDKSRSYIVDEPNRTRALTANRTLAVFDPNQITSVTNRSVPTMRAMGHHGSHANAGGQLAVAFAMQARMESLNPNAGPNGKGWSDEGAAFTLEAHHRAQSVAVPHAVRRLTPAECEALQAFPCDYTRIPYRGKPADQCPDGPRYKALGNSMAVNVMEWLGERIELVDVMTDAARSEAT